MGTAPLRSFPLLQLLQPQLGELRRAASSSAAAFPSCSLSGARWSHLGRRQQVTGAKGAQHWAPCHRLCQQLFNNHGRGGEGFPKSFTAVVGYNRFISDLQGTLQS